MQRPWSAASPLQSSPSLLLPLLPLLPAAIPAIEKNSNIKFIPVSSGPLRIGKLAPRMLTYGLRFSMKLPSARIDGRLDMYFFSRGRADASLMVLSLGKPARPIPISLERRLADLVARRLHR